MPHKSIKEMSMKKRNWIMVIIGAALLFMGSVFATDWMNYFNKTSSLYSAIAKPCITILAFILVLITGKDKLAKKDWNLLLLAFLCMLPTDILMSLVVVSPSLGVGGWVFMVGGGLSVLAHLFLIIRVGHGLGYLKKFKLSEIWLPILIYGSAVVVMLVLWKDVVRVGHAVIGPIYTAFFCTTLWFSWETVRRKLYPRANALMVAFAATCWYITEIFGEIYNLQIGPISNFVFNLVWIFYGTNVLLWALSGFRWKGIGSQIVRN